MIKDHPPELTYTFIYKMYAIVEINGQQFKAEAGQKLFVHHIEGAENGSTVEFEKVLLVDKDGNVTVGAPIVEGAKVVCQVVSNLVKGYSYGKTPPTERPRQGLEGKIPRCW